MCVADGGSRSSGVVSRDTAITGSEADGLVYSVRRCAAADSGTGRSGCTARIATMVLHGGEDAGCVPL